MIRFLEQYKYICLYINYLCTIHYTRAITYCYFVPRPSLVTMRDPSGNKASNFLGFVTLYVNIFVAFYDFRWSRKI